MHACTENTKNERGGGTGYLVVIRNEANSSIAWTKTNRWTDQTPPNRKHVLLYRVVSTHSIESYFHRNDIPLRTHTPGNVLWNETKRAMSNWRESHRQFICDGVNLYFIETKLNTLLTWTENFHWIFAYITLPLGHRECDMRNEKISMRRPWCCVVLSGCCCCCCYCTTVSNCTRTHQNNSIY